MPTHFLKPVTNPQPDRLTIASVTVDDAIVPFTIDGPRTLKRLRSTTIVVPYDWVADDPISVGVTSSHGIETTKEIAAAVEKLLDGDRGGRIAELPGRMKVTRKRGMLELSGKKGLKKGPATSRIRRG